MAQGHTLGRWGHQPGSFAGLFERDLWGAADHGARKIRLGEPGHHEFADHGNAPEPCEGVPLVVGEEVGIQNRQVAHFRGMGNCPGEAVGGANIVPD